MPSANILLGDCLDVMGGMDADTVDLIVTDPPYFRVKDEPWDRAWNDRSEFLSWLGEVADEWRRVLKPNGSLYCFASPQLAAHVQVQVIAPRFDVLSEIVWAKPDPGSFANYGPGQSGRVNLESLRNWWPSSERIVFAQSYGADGEHANAEDRLRESVFEPIRAYLDAERERAGMTVRQVAEAFQLKTGSRTVTGMAGHWFGHVQWALPTSANYEWLRGLLGGDYLAREYDYLAREYDDLRREYETLRRPFDVSRESCQWTDVWVYPTVRGGARAGNHVCEKPVEMLRHIIRTSSRPGATVLDTFAGSGSTGEAALRERRQFIGIEQDQRWHARATSRLTSIMDTPTLLDDVA